MAKAWSKNLASRSLNFWKIVQRDTIVCVSLLNDKESLHLTSKEIATQNCLELSKIISLKKLRGLNHRSHTTARQIKFWIYNVRRNHKNTIEIKIWKELWYCTMACQLWRLYVHCRITWTIMNEVPLHTEAWNVPKIPIWQRKITIKITKVTS
jgi:hypothetical protein